MFRRRNRQGQDGQDFPEADGADAGESGDDEFDDELEDGELEDGELDYAGEASLSGDGEAGEVAAGERRGADRDDLGDPATWTRLRDSAGTGSAVERPDGPWDSNGGYPQGERIDFGSLLVPVRDGYDVQVFMSEEEGISIAVVRGESGIQLQPFAAPRSAGLWSDVMPEIAEEVAKAGGQSTEQEGPFGPELLAKVSPQGSEIPIPPQPLRFLGADGPRWFLRGLISGPAATNRALAKPFEEIFADVVVVRGDHAEPPRKPLDIQLPDEAREVLEGQLEEQPDLLSPFERGPEITETR